MILPQTYMQTLILMIVSLVCLGSWAITLKAAKWRFELYYLDFAIGALFATIIYAATVGSLGFDGFSFWDDFFHASRRNWLAAFGAGMVFNLGNMLLTAAISVGGLSLAYPIGVGLSLIVGVGFGQMIRHEGQPLFLFCGFLMMLLAMVLAALSHSAKMAVQAHAILLEAQQSKKKHVRVPSAVKGILLSVIGGLIMAGHFPMLANLRQGDIGLGPYSCMFLFSSGVFLSTLVFSAFFANLPVEGEPMEFLDYLKGRLKSHVLGFGGGILWATGMLATILATYGEVPFHVGDIEKAAFTYGIPLVATCWGVLVWREYRTSESRVRSMSYFMLLALASGVALVSMAPMFVKTGP